MSVQQRIPIAKAGLFGLIAAMSAFVLATNERFFVDHADPMWEYYRPVFGWIVPHGLLGGIALLGGALQFSSRLRTAWPVIHRRTGYAYIVGVLGAAVLSVVITLQHNQHILQATITVQASLWITATLLAFYSIRTRRLAAHREWMMRSYAITLIFLTDRVLDAIPGLGAYDSESNPSVLWFCNLLAWVVPSLIVGWPGRRQA